MPVWIASFLGWLFSGLVDRILAIMNFFSKSAFVGGLTAFNIALAIAYGALITAIITLLKSIYDLVNKFVGYLNQASGGGINNDIVTTAFAVVKSVGIWQAFYDVFNIIMPMLFGFFLLIVAKIFFRIAKQKRDAYYQSVSLMTNNPNSKRIKKKK